LIVKSMTHEVRLNKHRVLYYLNSHLKSRFNVRTVYFVSSLYFVSLVVVGVVMSRVCVDVGLRQRFMCQFDEDFVKVPQLQQTTRLRCRWDRRGYSGPGERLGEMPFDG
jgi:hypothetical protein